MKLMGVGFLCQLWHSAIIVSSTNFHRSVSATSISSIINKNSHSPKLVPWGTPAGMSLHSDLQLCASFVLCLWHLRKSMIQHLIWCGILSVTSFRVRTVSLLLRNSCAKVFGNWSRGKNLR